MHFAANSIAAPEAGKVFERNFGTNREETLAKVDEARSFVMREVIDPALASPHLEMKVKFAVRNSKLWLDRFERVGDILQFLDRFDGTQSKETYELMHSHGLKTFEEIRIPFKERFELWGSDRSSPSSFVVGQQYDIYQILPLVKIYDTRAGGMFVLGSKEYPEAVLIKATLEGGAYANAWLKKPDLLKYFLKKRDGVFKESFIENAAILNVPNIPILTFVRDTEKEKFTYYGSFAFEDISREADGSKWFALRSTIADSDADAVEDLAFEFERLQQAVAEADGLSDEQLETRLRAMKQQPTKRNVRTTIFVRNPLVVVSVLRRATGKCEACLLPAPFRRRTDGTAYLEVHHRIRLADGGLDTVENAVALCPNCHRESHYGT